MFFLSFCLYSIFMHGQTTVGWYTPPRRVHVLYKCTIFTPKLCCHPQIVHHRVNRAFRELEIGEGVKHTKPQRRGRQPLFLLQSGLEGGASRGPLVLVIGFSAAFCIVRSQWCLKAQPWQVVAVPLLRLEVRETNPG